MEDISVIEKDFGTVLEIEERVRVWKIPFVMGRDIRLIQQHVRSQHLDCKEAPYARYLDIDWDTEMKRGAFANFLRMFTMRWHFHVGMPVPSNSVSEGHATLRSMPNKRYIRMLHRGPYQNVGSSYRQMYVWAQAQGISFDNQSIEIYLNDPRTTQKECLETVLFIPVAN